MTRWRQANGDPLPMNQRYKVSCDYCHPTRRKWFRRVRDLKSHVRVAHGRSIRNEMEKRIERGDLTFPKGVMI